MTNVYFMDHFDLYNIEIKESSEISIKIDSVPNTKIKEVIKNGAEILFQNKASKKILSKILNVEILQISEKQDVILSADDEVYVAQFTGPTIQENTETMPTENDVFFLKVSFKKIK